ncbi:uncharacterized protein PV06_10023 [Exophiala oligosperma]|uniref:N-acetyltransferase domain-containing protein n=1 Tax=Exophiala oligosperma TaxID=215243 RepID=A0A0D2BL34_9EURO|nr:uncharacterized protein PV06_10023 [Exophiala oligosperma]KIW38052.1 hypothetical protein PV06_10023 [Exophiala oligosperma]
MDTSDASFKIPVPHPTSRIYLTPPRREDDDVVIAALNDPRVYMNLSSPPYPYTSDDRRSWFAHIEKIAQHNAFGIGQFKKQPYLVSGAQAGGAVPWLGEVGWAATIREIVAEADGNERYLGEITVSRSGFLFVLDVAEREKARLENDNLRAGDPNIVWEVGFYLVPEHHGRGVMPKVLETVIREILLPLFNAQNIVATYFEHNIASKKVFAKCGFEYVTTIPDAYTLEPSKTGGQEGQTIGLGVIKWEDRGAARAREDRANGTHY